MITPTESRRIALTVNDYESAKEICAFYAEKGYATSFGPVFTQQVSSETSVFKL